MSAGRLRFGVTAILGAAAMVLWWQRGAQAQSAPAEVAWEYATVEELEQYNVGNIQYNSANICYHTTNGCRWDTIRVNTTRWSQTNDAVAAATARLGNQGWEVVSTTPPVQADRFSVLLKRLQRQNASEAPVPAAEPETN